ncbi:hypothetical protein ABBQ38_003431 [Trebouxia sp. C0009 RCD-2024]
MRTIHGSKAGTWQGGQSDEWPGGRGGEVISRTWSRAVTEREQYKLQCEELQDSQGKLTLKFGGDAIAITSNCKVSLPRAARRQGKVKMNTDRRTACTVATLHLQKSEKKHDNAALYSAADTAQPRCSQDTPSLATTQHMIQHQPYACSNGSHDKQRSTVQAGMEPCQFTSYGDAMPFCHKRQKKEAWSALTALTSQQHAPEISMPYSSRCKNKAIRNSAAERNGLAHATIGHLRFTLLTHRSQPQVYPIP